MRGVGVLGSVEVWLDGERLPIGPPVRRGLLAMLALDAGEAVPVERLAGALRGDAGPDDVHEHVSRLREVLGPAGFPISRRSAGYALDVDPSVVDLHEFRALVRAATAPEELRDALRLWRGSALSGVGDSEVLLRIGTDVDAERLTVAEKWAAESLDLGRHHEVPDELSAVVAEHPLREELVALEVLALHRCGRQADAVRRYEETRALLADELGIGPGPRLRALHERILRTDTPSPATTPAERPVRPRVALPFDVPDFTGRTGELARLGAEAVVVVVDGMAGVGKTALAVHAVHRLGDRYPDARVFVDLHGFTPGRGPVSPFAALDTLLRAIGVPPADVPGELDQRITAWRAEMAARRAVVVLDNAVDAEQVVPLLTGAPGCLTVVTSRRRLVIDGAAQLSLDVLTESEARDLVAEILGARAAEEPDEVASLVELCGRLPLALRIAAARLAHRPRWTVGDLVERLGAQLRRLVELKAGDRDVLAAFAVSYDHLTSEQQSMFRLLGQHPGVDFDLYAAAALAGTAFHDAREVLEDLLDHHLLVRRVRDRYSFHDLVREYARSLGPEPGVHRLLDYYLHVAHLAADLVQPGRESIPPDVDDVPGDVPPLPDDVTAMAWFTAERENLVAASRYAAESGSDRHTCGLLRDIGHSLIIGEHLDDLVELQEPALAAARRLGDRVAEMACLHNMTVIGYSRCRYREAQANARLVLDVARELGDVLRESTTLAVLGMVAHRLGRFGDALEHYRTALAIQQRIHSHRFVAIGIANVGRVHLALGDPEAARVELETALVRSREINERGEEASVLCGLGAAFSRLGDHDRALALLHEGVALAESIGNTHYAMRGLIKTADALRRAGDLPRARDFAGRAFAALGHGASRDHLSTAHNVLGAIERADGRLDEAVVQHRRALEIASRIEYRIEQAWALDSLADLLDGAVARRHRRQADELCAEMGVLRLPG
ncbi:AfsR/SARP family transcriptional regulator [Lentzea tibetensis]|uniref:AfsR/SARP family transcriptional regulator n=1 Tax=Lentzea tibetensis TaxID=2591470 RepID=UPI001646A920|nr:BTAD domain-containing putative transcriptional regulator [Lentzea tibetensis]